ncbi:MAG: SIR2 family protein [Thermodesulfobacteriota bacterium]|nr:SIR2 family protein [Thermodesulfobacteriota bacterium]
MLSLDDLTRLSVKLWPIIKNGNCVAWVGAGLSEVADYPGWQETVRHLCKACQVTPLPPEHYPSADELMDKADECKQANLTAYNTSLGQLFGGPVVTTRRAFHLLMKLPFRAYVTTNFDPLLDDAAGAHGKRTVCTYPALPIPIIERNPGSIFHLHGLARQNNMPRGEGLVLSTSEYDLAYGNTGPVADFLTQLLLYYDVLFIGCSLAEPAMYEAFARVHTIHLQIQRSQPGARTPQRFVLRPTLYSGSDEIRIASAGKGIERDYQAEQAEDVRFGEMEIEVVRYEPTDDRHSEVEELLEQLCNRAHIQVSSEVRHGLSQKVFP